MEKQNRHQVLINNAFYDDLEDRWYESTNHPVALLRAENKVRVPWVIESVKANFSKSCHILDIGCGAGMLANALAVEQHNVTGIDLSKTSLEVAQKYDRTNSVKYKQASAYDLPFSDQSFDVVTAMDVLEHVEDPFKLIKEGARVLKHGGLFFFHTFNRNWLSYFLVIKGVDWFVPNAVANMHVYNLFIKPKKLREMGFKNGLKIEKIMGFRPKILQKPLWNMIFHRDISEDFSFIFTKNLSTGYSGFFIKQ
ncbi:MAG: bifunctional 2-polyprenyl-6-hydroxyphenol methylase/3-demethylubiquinol 3-O-methyltransferase UbiG [Chlamydiota bacterium]|jgi:2-polyprenyl-6-hydroxyphenyl methylase/3-demethylubiquinone-9 3-methyltransferase